MDSYEVIVTAYAISQLNDYVSYLQFTLFREDAADNVWKDAIETSDQLTYVAGSLQPCKHPKLRALGYHPIFFKHQDYVMLYRIDNKVVYVDAIYHQLQDYENLFAEELPD